jgi:hypothetical protein
MMVLPEFNANTALLITLYVLEILYSAFLSQEMFIVHVFPRVFLPNTRLGLINTQELFLAPREIKYD